MTNPDRTNEVIKDLRKNVEILKTEYPKNASYRIMTVGRAPDSPNYILITTGRNAPSDRQDIVRVLMNTGYSIQNCKFRWNHLGSLTLMSF